MIDILEQMKIVIDAPPEAVLACPVGLITALHFASGTNPEIKGARGDSVVRQARLELVARPAWVKMVGIGLGLTVAACNFLYIQDPQFLTAILTRLPI